MQRITSSPLSRWLLVFSFLFAGLVAQQANAESNLGVEPGNHLMSLQWLLKWDNKIKQETNFGTLHISEPNAYGWQRAKGVQQFLDKDGKPAHLIIDGIIKETSPRVLTFEGKISTQVPYNYNGKACEREGKFSFLAHGDRPYWRMTEKENCEGSADYVDIYFK